MTHQPFDDKHESDFRQWQKELRGENDQPDAPANGRAKMVKTPDGLKIVAPDRGSDDVVDKYGLRVLSAEDLSVEEQNLRRWDSALLNYPYNPPERVGKNFAWAFVLSYRAQCLRNGVRINRADYADYVKRWEAVGIGAELYLWLNAEKRSAIQRAEERMETDEQRLALNARLEYLHLTPEDHRMQGRSLVPEHWKDLPYLLTRLRPCLAIRDIVLPARI